MTDPIRPILEREWPCERTISTEYASGYLVSFCGENGIVCPACRQRAKFERVLGEILALLSPYLDDDEVDHDSGCPWWKSETSNISESGCNCEAFKPVRDLIRLAREHAKEK